MPITTNDFSTKVAEYKYFAVDILSNEIKAEIPFYDVGFERALKGAGAFSGKVSIAPDTEDLDLYNTTLPGKIAIFITRNGICIWGGIIWSRTYTLTNRVIDVNASEFTSYLYHRNIWKSYNFDLACEGVKEAEGDKLKITFLEDEVTLATTDANGGRNKVKVTFTENGYAKYTDYYGVESSPAPTSSYFYVDIPELPARPDSYFSGITVSARTDTYDYIRYLITEAFEDFTDVEFANEYIAPGIRTGFDVTYREISSSVATITTSAAHGLVVGQRVEILNVHSDVNGKWTVTDVPTSTSFRFTANTATLANAAVTLTTYPLKYRKTTNTARLAVNKVKVLSNVVTLTTTVPHSFKVGDLVIMNISGGPNNAYKTYSANGAAKLVTAVAANNKTLSYSLTTANTKSTGINLTNSYVNYSVPRRRMELDIYPGYSHNFSVDDEVFVNRVDDPSWDGPMYDGYHFVTAIESGASPTWFQYAPAYDLQIEPNLKRNITKRKYIYKNANNILIDQVTITTDVSHGFLPGDFVYIDTKAKGNIAGLDGLFTIQTTPSDIEFTYKPSSSAKKNIKLQEVKGTVERRKTLISAVARTGKTITAKQRVGSTATLTTSAAHGFVERDFVLVESGDSTFNNGGEPVEVTDVVSATRFSYTNAGSPVSNTATSGSVYDTYTDFGTVIYPSAANCTGGSTTRTITANNHGLTTNTWVTVFIAGSSYNSVFNNDGNPVKITSTTTNTFSYTYGAAAASTVSVSGLNTKSQVVRVAYVSKKPTAYVRSYGEFPGAADLGGIEFSTSDYSSKQYINDEIRGGYLLNLGEHLDKYSNLTNGFDYRIDCDIQTVNGIQQFKKTFVLIPRIPTSYTEYIAANPLAAGEYAPPSAFGADLLTFEYPGNISDVTLDENAENSATRVFVVGNSDGAGANSSPRYSAAVAGDLLADGWPLYDAVEKQSSPLESGNKVNIESWGNFQIEDYLYETAARFIEETKPPMGEYSITINGSLDPVVGTYDPGDWCQLVINDDFVRQRLASPLEPRSNVIVRKIESINVKVPNSPAFPEQITLNVIPEWQVDRSGE
jgi:hypothetical protein